MSWLEDSGLDPYDPYPDGPPEEDEDNAPKHPLAGMTDVFKGSRPSKLDEQLQDIYMAGWQATAPDFNDPEFLEARSKLLALIEEVKLENLEQLCNDWIKTHGPSDELTAGEVYDWLKLYQMGNKLQSQRLRKDAL